METDLTISVNPIEEMVADALEAVDRGYRILKIKVGKEGRADVERIAAIRSAVGPDILLRVDANQGWNADSRCPSSPPWRTRGWTSSWWSSR